MKIISDDVINNVLEILNKQKLFRYDCTQPVESEVARLEDEYARLTGFKYAIAMNSCSSAIFTSLLCAGVKPNDKVMLPAFTFIAVPSSIIHAHAIPVLVEVNDDYVIDLEALAQVYAREKPKYLLLSHMRGRLADMDKLADFCNQHGIRIIEDCAHALGVLWKGKQAGYHGIAANFSMQSYKMLDGGEGGILCTNDRDIAIRAMLYAGCYESNWSKHYLDEEGQRLADEMVNQLPAYNFRMSNLTAAAIRPQLNVLEDRVEKYNLNYACFVDILEQSDNIRVPEFTRGSRPAPDTAQFQILTDDKDSLREIIARLKEDGIVMDVFGLSEKNARAFWRWGFCDFDEGICDKTRQQLLNTADIRLRLEWDKQTVTQVAEKIVSTVDAVLPAKGQKKSSYRKAGSGY